MLLQRLSENSLWNSMRELDLVRQKLDQMVSSNLSTMDYPPVNVWVSENDAIVEAEIAGLDTDGIELSVADDTLTIKGARQETSLKEGEKYHRQERGFGQFSRTLQLPFKIEASAVEATFNKGVLQITLPRAIAERPKKITVKQA